LVVAVETTTLRTVVVQLQEMASPRGQPAWQATAVPAATATTTASVEQQQRQQQTATATTATATTTAAATTTLTYPCVDEFDIQAGAADRDSDGSSGATNVVDSSFRFT